METVDVLENVRLTVGDQHNIQLVQRLVHEAHVVLLDGGMLGSGVCELGEGGEKGFNSGPRDLPELAREDRFTSAGAYRRCENDLLCCVLVQFPRELD